MTDEKVELTSEALLDIAKVIANTMAVRDAGTLGYEMTGFDLKATIYMHRHERDVSGVMYASGYAKIQCGVKTYAMSWDSEMNKDWENSYARSVCFAISQILGHCSVSPVTATNVEDYVLKYPEWQKITHV